MSLHTCQNTHTTLHIYVMELYVLLMAIVGEGEGSHWTVFTVPTGDRRRRRPRAAATTATAIEREDDRMQLNL